MDLDTVLLWVLLMQFNCLQILNATLESGLKFRPLQTVLKMQVAECISLADDHDLTLNSLIFFELS